MSLEDRLAVIGDNLTSTGKYFTLLRVVGVIKGSDEIKTQMGLEREATIIITSLPTDFLEKNQVYVANIILPRLPGINNNRTGAYLLNINLENFKFKEIYYDDYIRKYVMRIYEEGSVAYVDNKSLMKRSPYIVILVNPYNKMKLSEEISHNIRRYIN